MNFVLSTLAEADIAKAATDYESARPGLGSAFIEHVHLLFARIRRHPEMAPSIGRGFRRAVLYRFPYCVIYRAKPNVIEITGVLPTTVAPRRTSQRTKMPSSRH